MSPEYVDPILDITFRLTGAQRDTEDGLMHEVLDTSWDTTVWWSDALVAHTFGEVGT